MMLLKKKKTAEIGERIAEKFLKNKGFRIIARNHFTPFGEIDIIAEKNGIISFVEVKTRISDRFGSPLRSITGEKQKHIIKNCFYYMKHERLSSMSYRIDAIGIELFTGGDLKVLKYIKNIIRTTY